MFRKELAESFLSVHNKYYASSLLKHSDIYYL
jgi:hypothetical protein